MGLYFSQIGAQTQRMVTRTTGAIRVLWNLLNRMHCRVPPPVFRSNGQDRLPGEGIQLICSRNLFSIPVHFVYVFSSIGAVYGSKFSIWDISHLQGGKPAATGSTFPEGGHQFRYACYLFDWPSARTPSSRWCHTYPEYFAISTQSPAKGAVIHVHNVNYIHAQPTVFNIYPRPHLVRDFDFLAIQGIPRLAAATGPKVVIFSIGVDS